MPWRCNHNDFCNENLEKLSWSQVRRLRVTKGDDWWIDHEAPPNGIGPVCLFCRHLIDWAPTDHALACPVRIFNRIEMED